MRRGIQNVGPTRVLASVVAVAAMLSVAGCAGPSQHVARESGQWGAFAQVLGGALAAGPNLLPAHVREGHCYRVVLGSAAPSPPRLTFQGQIDSESVGFPIRALDRRSPPDGGGTVSVFGFCSQGSGTVQLVAELPAPGHGVLLEASFGALDPSVGPDVAEAMQWVAQRQASLAARRAAQERERLAAAVEQLVASLAGELRAQVDVLAGSRGRYTEVVLDEVRGARDVDEALVLEPGRCYLFAAVPHGSTALEVDVMFSRIRNAAERSDEGGGVTYGVCTAPSGPIQEVRFTVRATVPPGAPHPPVFVARVAHRAQSSAERRAADAEWLRNDPDGS